MPAKPDHNLPNSPFPLPSPTTGTSAAAQLARRWFLRECGVGLGSMALGSLLAQSGYTVEAAEANPQTSASGKASPLAPRAPHFAPRAKRVIYMFQAGGPSHLELFDYKPKLAEWDGKLPPPELLKGYRAAFIHPNSALLGPRYKFAQHGQSGNWLSEILPHTAAIADDICIIRSLHTDAVNHAPAQILMNTGSQQFGRPSFGAWTIYGLGSEATELPGYVVLSSANGTSGGAGNWGCGFLPTVYTGVPFRGTGDPVLYLSSPRGFDSTLQRESLDSLRKLNEMQSAVTGDPEIAARIEAYEMAYRMQTSAPELMDLRQETKDTLDMYGADPKQPSYARNCLLARRLIERGVRFVQLLHEAWDQHGDLKNGVKRNCEATDKASAALVRDLKQRGLLEDTLVVWGGEFGRTPMVQGGNDGRDHHNRSYSIWLAGGGIKPGITWGETDEFGFNVARDGVHVHDLNATLLHLLGMDHTKLTYRSQGRDFRLTDVHGEVVKGILA
ncbi:MAG: DUF1501 domain-containing protein [Pirellulales bacterium]|nr:DUF1501 domain-containing protein [Pirellulales bacterium]